MNYFNYVNRKSMNDFKKISTRGGKREGAGRPSEGKERFTVTLTAENVESAKAAESNLSGLLDRLLSNWLGRRAKAR